MDIPPPAALRKIAREVHAMANDPPEGIRMILNEDMSDIQAWIQGPEGTPYAEGYFRLRIQLNADFPNAPPKCFFMTKIFHPNVSTQGEVCVSTLKKDWKKDLGLRHILLVVKCLLIVPNPESALNEEAGRQLLERYDDYAGRARLMTEIYARSAGKDVFTPLKRPGGGGGLGSSSDSNTTTTSAETGGETTTTKEATIKNLAMKDAPKSGSDRLMLPQPTGSGPTAFLVDEHATAATPSSSSSPSEFSATTTTGTISTKRKLGSVENRTEQEPAASSSSTPSCSSSSALYSSASTSITNGRLSTTPQHQQQPRTILTAQRNTTSASATTGQSKTQSNLTVRQTLQGPPPAHRNQGYNQLQKQSCNGIFAGDQQHQQQEQQLPKDDPALLNNNNNNLMLSPKMAHHTLLGTTTTTTTATITTAASTMSSSGLALGSEGSVLGVVKGVTSRPTTTTTVPACSVHQHLVHSGLAGSCSGSYSHSQQLTTTTAMLRSSCLIAPHNLSSLSHVQSELHVDKKRALRRL
ncbi:hypothetical protein BGX29_008565 [Mortierella sp. GBA35]|nr:hypothetical protein BGX29_008565 [Mortierella sp. GBA35]